MLPVHFGSIYHPATTTINKRDTAVRYEKTGNNKGALQIYKQLADDEQDAHAQYRCSILYARGENGVQKNIHNAFYYLQLSAAQNYSTACADLGMSYIAGEFFVPNIDEGLRLIQVALNSDDGKWESPELKAHYLQQAAVYVENGRDAAAILIYESLAATGNAYAQHQCYQLHAEGYRIPLNIEKALDYLEKAVAQMYPIACACRGMLSTFGKYIPKNVEEGLRLTKFALDSDDDKWACAELKAHYLQHAATYTKHGQHQAALLIYESLAQTGDPYGQCQCYILYINGRNGIPLNVEKAMSYLKFSAFQQYPRACACLGMHYLRGKHIDQNMEEGLRFIECAVNSDHSAWVVPHVREDYHQSAAFCAQNGQDKAALLIYRQLAKADDAEAQFQCSVLYARGKNGVIQNMDQALSYLQSAVRLHHVRACASLGRLYMEGVHIEQDIGLGIYYTKLAAHANDAVACNELVTYYIEGRGVEKNGGAARFYWKKAVELGFLELI